MDLNELAERLALIEDRDAERLVADEQRSFLDKYGTQFSGDEGIGMAILAEMNRRGISSAAVGADRVVQEILDGIRQEATMILDKIKADREVVNDLISQVKDVQESVNSAVAGDGVVDMPPEVGDVLGEEDLPPPVDMPPEVMPDEVIPSAEDLPPVENLPPTEGSELGPVEPEPMLEPNVVPSDVRVKRLIKPQAALKPKIKANRAPSHILSAITRGI